MNTLTTLAGFVQSPDLSRMPQHRLDRVKRHVIDTWAAQMAGSRTEAGAAVAALMPPMDGWLSTIVTRCAQARCTEIDDIHLRSCTTPGAVVVSTGLALAAAPTGERVRVQDFCAAVLAGYESMIRLGVAIDGPTVLHTGVWPTAFTAAFGSAATAARLLRLNVDQTAGALGTSLALAQHRAAAASSGRSSRWLSLGIAAAGGVLAAHGAHGGLVGTIDVGVPSARLTHRLGRRYLFDEIGMKPFPTARQALAAIEAAGCIVEEETLAASDVRGAVVSLPERQRAIVDRPGFPKSRFDSIVNVRYQVALAIAAPGRLLDVARTPPFDSRAVRRLMTKIQVTRARDLDSYYPKSWPARVEIDARGRRWTRVVLDAHGDAGRPVTWPELAAKVTSIAAPVAGASETERLLDEWRAADPSAPMPVFP